MIRTVRSFVAQTPRLLVGLALVAAFAAQATAVTWDANTDSTWTDADSNSFVGTYNDGGPADFLGAGTGTVTVTGGGVNPSATTVNAAGGSDYTFAGGSISGSLVKLGANTLFLDAANTFSSIDLGGGILDYDGDDRLGSGTLTFSGTSTLKYNNVPTGGVVSTNLMAIGSGVTATIDSRSPNNNPAQFDGIISGGGGGATLTITGAGNSRPRLDGTNTFAADVIISGAVRIDVNSDAGFGNVANTLEFAGGGMNLQTNLPRDISVTGSTVFSVSGSRTLSGALTGSFQIQKSGSGDLILTGNNSGFSGTWFLNQGNNGRISVGSQNNLGTGTLRLIGNDPILSLTGATPGSFSNTVQLSANTPNSLRMEVVDPSATATFTSAVIGPSSGALRKTGTGTLSLDGNNTYPGATNVEAGTLNINGTTSGQGNFTVSSGATLGGTGTIGLSGGNSVTIQSAGILSAGASSGILSITGDLVLDSGAIIDWEYDGSGEDLVSISGLLTLPLTATINAIDLGGTLSDLPVVLTAGALSGTSDLSGWTVTGLAGYTVAINGNNVVLEAPVPEPSTGLLLGLGFVLLRSVRRRRR